MPDIKNLQLKNIEKEKSVKIERVEEAEQKIGQEIQAPEKEPKIEISPADKEIVLDEVAKAEKQAQAIGLAPVSAVQQKYQQREKQIESILSNGLDDLYIKMPADKQQEFKAVGEQTARKINNLLNQAKVRVKKIIGLIRKWLLIIPGVNKFFLEQEAKIKADEVMRLKK
ncbi:MAG: hypothetical protein U9R14_00735 [Patescibacteria group bacterium]|nr:hypothetical protein [Patescibacteria group bacterium]